MKYLLSCYSATLPQDLINLKSNHLCIFRAAIKCLSQLQDLECELICILFGEMLAMMMITLLHIESKAKYLRRNVGALHIWCRKLFFCMSQYFSIPDSACKMRKSLWFLGGCSHFERERRTHHEAIGSVPGSCSMQPRSWPLLSDPGWSKFTSKSSITDFLR